MERRGTDGEEREEVDFATLARIPAGAYVSSMLSVIDAA